ncbi:MAG: hypothetical protein RLZ12_749 [Bacillota bacterium]
MSITRQKKEEIAADLEACLRESQGVVVANYTGLNAQETTDLRRQSREQEVVLRVVKNTITERVANKLELGELTQYLSGANMLAFSASDPLAPAKVVYEFAKKTKKLTLKGGVIEGKSCDRAELEALAALPAREVLLAMLLNVLQAPMRQLAATLQAVLNERAS